MSGGLRRDLMAGGLCKYIDEIGYVCIKVHVSIHPTVLHYRYVDRGYESFEFRWPLRYNDSPGVFNIRFSQNNDVTATPNYAVIKHHLFCDRLSKFSELKLLNPRVGWPGPIDTSNVPSLFGVRRVS